MLSSVGDTGVTSGLVASRPLVGWDGETYLRETFSVWALPGRSQHRRGGKNKEDEGSTSRTRSTLFSSTRPGKRRCTWGVSFSPSFQAFATPKRCNNKGFSLDALFAGRLVSLNSGLVPPENPPNVCVLYVVLCIQRTSQPTLRTNGDYSFSYWECSFIIPGMAK